MEPDQTTFEEYQQPTERVYITSDTKQSGGTERNNKNKTSTNVIEENSLKRSDSVDKMDS